jgi:hypothetical protein
MEGEGKGSHAWWPMEGEIEAEAPFHPLPLSPQETYLNIHFFI